MTLITRKEYISRANAAHRRETSSTPHEEFQRYYTQFVTEGTKRHVLWLIPADILENALAQDKHLNSIDLAVWDRITWRNVDGKYRSPYTAAGNVNAPFHGLIPFDREAIANAGDTVTRSVLVCIAKQAARLIVHEHLTSTTPAAATAA